MAERSIAAVLKTVDLRGSGGSNPSLSAENTNPLNIIDMKKAVKFLTVAFVAVMTLAVTGCQKDPEDLIIGSWQVESQVYTTTAGSRTHTDTETPKAGESIVLTFNKDLSFVGTMTWTEDGETVSETHRGTYSISGDQVAIAVTSSWQDDYGEWHSEVDTETLTIKTLDKKVLVLVMSETETEDGVTVTYSDEINLKRI